MPSKLFQPITIGKAQLSHRIALAPLTRFRANDAHEPLPMVATYYAQRASTPGTFLITEATFISAEASGYPNAPGLYTDAQLRAWRKVTDAVHAQGSTIFVQLWALGRAAKPNVLEREAGLEIHSASAIPMSEDAPVPREMSEEDIQRYIKNYAQAAKNAVEVAGFDGVEIHGANGYLMDQFTQDVSNHRTDAWGGSIENRARFALSAARAVIDAIGSQRTAIRLSPFSTFQGMRMADPVPQFTYLITELRKLDLAYLHVVESRIAGSTDAEEAGSLDFALDAWGRDNKNPFILAGGFSAESAKKAVTRAENVLVAFGRYFIANPDLVYRVAKDIPLAKYNRDTFYVPKDPKGYIDQPFSDEWEAEFGGARAITQHVEVESRL